MNQYELNSEQARGVLELLREIQETLPQLDREAVLTSTKRLLGIVDRIYSKPPRFLDLLVSAKQYVGRMVIDKSDNVMWGNTLEMHKGHLAGIVDAMITEIEILGLPSVNDLKVDRPVTVNVSQHQSQIQSMEVNIFLEALKDELSGAQWKEIQAIVKSETDPQQAKSKIVEKLKSFGENVFSNIVSGLITNPAIWQGILS